MDCLTYSQSIKLVVGLRYYFKHEIYLHQQYPFSYLNLIRFYKKTHKRKCIASNLHLESNTKVGKEKKEIYTIAYISQLPILSNSL